MLCQSVPFSNVVQDMNRLRYPIPKSLSSGKGLAIASLKASIFSVISILCQSVPFSNVVQDKRDLLSLR